jgi:hypothetical protein
MIRFVLQVAAVFLLSSLAVYDLVAAWMLNRRELALPFFLCLVGLLVLGGRLVRGACDRRRLLMLPVPLSDKVM